MRGHVPGGRWFEQKTFASDRPDSHRTPEMLRERDPRMLIPPLHGALLTNEQDVHLFERLAFLGRS